MLMKQHPLIFVDHQKSHGTPKTRQEARAKKAIDGKHGRKYVEKKCDCGSTSSYTTSSSYDSEDNAKVEEDMEFEDKSWKHVKNYDGNRHGCICLVELDENGEEYTVDKVMMV